MDSLQIVIEVIVAIAVVLIQLFFFYTTYQKIQLLSGLFPLKNLDETFLLSSDAPNGQIQTIKIDNQIYSKEFSEVIGSINKYLKKNQGATDFSIIKSIVERSIETRDNAVSSNITLPLYIGLMGTFTGIIMGLVKIGFGGGVTEENINSFIGGVVIAMVASFFGLLLTVINNSKNFKDAKAICDERKNSFYNFLQVELLPHLGNSLFDALDRLKYNINDFNKKFENNIQLFDTKFSDNITSLRISVESLSENIGAVIDNTQTQKHFLFELKKIGYNRMAEANMKVFSLLKETGPTFIQFIEKQKELTKSVEHAAGFVQTIESILNRVKTFENSLNNLGESINTKQYLGNEVLKRIDSNLSYLDKQYELLKQHGTNSTEKIDDYFNRQFEEIQKLSIRIRHEIEEAFNVKVENNPLHKLHLLSDIGRQMDEIKGKINFNGEFNKISDDLSSTKSVLTDIKQKLTKAIEDNRNRSSQVLFHEEKQTEKGKGKEQTKENRTLINRFTNLFKRNSGRKA